MEVSLIVLLDDRPSDEKGIVTTGLLSFKGEKQGKQTGIYDILCWVKDVLTLVGKIIS